MVRRLVLFAWMAALPLSVLAEETTPAQGSGFSLKLPNPLGCTGANDQATLCITKILITALYTISIPLTVIMVIWSGYQFLTAAGNEEKISSARKTLLYTVIGFGVIVLSGALRGIITGLLAVD